MRYLVMAREVVYRVTAADDSGLIIAIEVDNMTYKTDYFCYHYLGYPLAEAKRQWRLANYTVEEDMSR